MTQPGPADQSRPLRRLPKRPSAGTLTGTPAIPEDARTWEDIPAASQPGTALYFEKLPDPLFEDTVEPHPGTQESWTVSGPQVPPPQQTPAAPDDPTLYFRRATPSPSVEDSNVFRFREDPHSRPPADVQPPAPMESPAQELQPQLDPSANERTGDSGGRPRAQEIDVSDPKPASARIAAISRSRQARASGQYSTARASGDFLAKRTSGAMPASRNSASHVAAYASGETPVPPARAASEQRTVEQSASHQDDVSLDSGAEQETETTKARKSNRKAIAGMAVASIALIAYAFEIGALEDAANTAAGHMTTSGSALSSLLPWLLVVPAVLLFGVIVWLLAGMIGLRSTGRKARRQKDRKQPATPLNQFKAAALRQGVDNRTAYRGWRLLEAASPNSGAISVDSSLTTDLGLAQREIRALHLQLLSDLSRASDPAMRLPNTETVLDLLKAVDAAPVVRPRSDSSEVVVPGDPGQRKRKSS